MRCEITSVLELTLGDFAGTGSVVANCTEEVEATSVVHVIVAVVFVTLAPTPVIRGGDVVALAARVWNETVEMIDAADNRRNLILMGCRPSGMGSLRSAIYADAARGLRPER